MFIVEGSRNQVIVLDCMLPKQGPILWLVILILFKSREEWNEVKPIISQKQQQVTVAGQERDVAIFVVNMVVVFLFVLRCAYGGFLFLFQPIKWIRHKITSNDLGFLCKSYVQQENTMACWGIRLLFSFSLLTYTMPQQVLNLRRIYRCGSLRD